MSARFGVTVWLAVAIAALGMSDGADAASRKTRPVHITGSINLNQATVSQLDLLPGIGEKAARKIIAHREKTPFTRAEDIVKVKGFGKKRFEKLRPHLAISGPTTLKVEKGAPVAASAMGAVHGRSSPPAKR